MSKKNKIRIPLLLAVSVITATVIWYIGNNEEDYLQDKRCAKCKELEELQDVPGTEKGSLPFYKGIISINKDSSIQFSEQHSGQTYTVMPCDAACDHFMYRLIVDDYRAAQYNNDTLWLGIWGIKDETKHSIAMESFVVTDSKEQNDK